MKSHLNHVFCSSSSFIHGLPSIACFSRCCTYPLLFCWDAPQHYANGNCVSDPAHKQRQMQGYAGKISPEAKKNQSLFTTFPTCRCKGFVRAGLLVSMASSTEQIGLVDHPQIALKLSLSPPFCGLFAKTSLQR